MPKSEEKVTSGYPCFIHNMPFGGRGTALEMTHLECPGCAKDQEVMAELVKVLKAAYEELKDGGHASEVEGIAAKCPNCLLCEIEAALARASESA